MDGLIIRRRCMAPVAKGDEWEVFIHNTFNTYTTHKDANGNLFDVKDNGEWVEVVSNGKNNNNSNITLKNLLVYEEIKDKTCRISWNVECSDASSFTTSNGAGNLTFDFYRTTPHTGNASSGRVSKLDFATLIKGNIIGQYSEEFIPSVLLASITKGTYLGWHFAFRSSITGLTWRIKELTFEIKK